MASYILILALLPFIQGWITEMENDDLYQGDIELNPGQMFALHSGSEMTFGSIWNKKWGRTIPYDYDGYIAGSQKAINAIQAAIKDYEHYTCLRFVRRTTERDYIHFYQGTGCRSPVGRQGGANRVSLAKGCWSRGTVIHEMGHSLGFWHEQSRPDRNSYLDLFLHNVDPKKMHNFNIAKSIDSRGSPYDYRSIMHYDKRSFGKGGKITMLPKDRYYEDLIGTGQGFSATDIEQLNNLYECPVYTGPKPIKPTQECHDTSGYCEMWKADYGCARLKPYKQCPLICGHCTLAPCKDEYTGCHLTPGRCKESGPSADHFKKMCRKTCGYC